MTEKILAIAKEIEPRLIQIRRDIHSHPELGLQEERTAKLVADTLEELGLEVKRNFFATGVVGLLKGGKPGKTLLIRADMDALPVQEENDLPYRSTCDGKMHACGHDAHTTWLLGTAMILSRLKEDLCGNVKFMFQPAEEAPGGADEMIHEGLLENPKVDMAMAAHVSADMPVGKLIIQDGPVTANPDFFKLTLHGKGTHGAYPQNGIDALNMGVQVYNQLSSFVSRLSDACDEVVLSVCKMEAGTSRGAVAGECVLEGTVRSFRPEIRQQAKEFLENSCKAITQLYGGSYDFYYEALSFPVMNDPAVTQKVREAAAKIVGEDGVVSQFKKFMGGEDYCFVARAVPSTFLYVGAMNDDLFPPMPLHNSHFQMDERVLAQMAAVLSQSAFQLLNG